ncbi:hypothetical protein [Sphingomonas rubra]|nr:hypothetical protein [Sphingomonas rubra]
MKRAATIVLIALMGCTQAQTDEGTASNNATTGEDPGPKIVWKDGPENSVFFVEHNEQGSYARRCWKRADGYDCLNASGPSAVPTLKDIFRFKLPALPVYRYDTSVYQSSGYGCKMTDRNIITEQVSAEQGTIKENLFTLDHSVSGQALTADQVANMLRENKVETKAPYFNCPAVAAVIAETDDVGTITTTAISYDDYMR